MAAAAEAAAVADCVIVEASQTTLQVIIKIKV